jgi:hypothetical protein
MANITVGGKGFEGVVATFNPRCVKKMEIIPTVDWVTFSIDTNTINAVVDAYTEDSPRPEQEFTINFTAFTENDDETEGEITSCSTKFTIGQLSKNFHPEEGGETPPEPPVGCTCLVDNCEEPLDLHEAELEASAGITCDSVWANNPDNYGFDVTYSQSPPPTTWERKSGDDDWLRPVIVPKVPGGCDSGPTGQANYTYLENTTGSERWAKVHWYWNKDQEEGMCSESNAYFRQFGGETPPSEPCDVKLTLSGLEGTDKATIVWGDGKKDENVGNEQITHTYSTGGKHTASISAGGYKQVSAEFDCDGIKEISKTMEKDAGDCDCDTMILVMGKTEFTLESAANSQDSTIVSWNNSCPPYIDNEASSWLNAQFVGGGDGDFEVKSITKNDGTEDRVGTIKIYANSSKETVCRTLTVTQKHGSGGGTIDKYVTIVMTTTPPIYMNSIQYKISLEPKETGQGTAVTLHDYDWFINEPCTDNPVKWTNNLQKTIKLTGSYTGNINLYNFKVDFQNRTLKKQNTSTLQCDGSETTATGTMRGIGSDAVEMNASNGYFLAPLTSESNIGTSINIALR